jgi:hypothetical protein
VRLRPAVASSTVARQRSGAHQPQHRAADVARSQRTRDEQSALKALGGIRRRAASLLAAPADTIAAAVCSARRTGTLHSRTESPCRRVVTPHSSSRSHSSTTWRSDTAGRESASSKQGGGLCASDRPVGAMDRIALVGETARASGRFLAQSTPLTSTRGRDDAVGVATSLDHARHTQWAHPLSAEPRAIESAPSNTGCTQLTGSCMEKYTSDAGLVRSARSRAPPLLTAARPLFVSSSLRQRRYALSLAARRRCMTRGAL